MTRKLLALVVGLLACSAAVLADDKKSDAQTFEGKLVCTKCTLGETTKCSHALKVMEGEKELVYLVDDKNKNHKEVCPAGTEIDVKVTGKLTEKDGKKTIADAKVEKVEN